MLPTCRSWVSPVGAWLITKSHCRRDFGRSVSAASGSASFSSKSSKAPVVALVTGGSRGIGRACAQALYDSGTNVAIFSRSEGNLLSEPLLNRWQPPTETAALLSLARAWADEGVLLNEPGDARRVFAMRCDVSDSAEVARAVSRVEEVLGPVNVLVNAAGLSRDQLLVRATDAHVHDVVGTNLIGPLYVTRAVCRSMLKLRHGSIVNVGSIVGTLGNTGQAVYSASKSALVGLTRSLASELGPKSIRINLVAPGYIATDMTAGISEKAAEALRNHHISLQRFGRAEEVAQLVLFLSSERASYITGQVIAVDGGFSLGASP